MKPRRSSEVARNCGPQAPFAPKTRNPPRQEDLGRPTDFQEGARAVGGTEPITFNAQARPVKATSASPLPDCRPTTVLYLSLVAWRVRSR